MAVGGKEASLTKLAGFHQRLLASSRLNHQVSGWRLVSWLILFILIEENGTRAPIVLDEEAIESSRRKFRSEILSGTDGFLNKEADHVAKLLQIANEYIPVIEEHNA